MAETEPTLNNTVNKYWVTNTQLQFLADAIRAASGKTNVLTFPEGFINQLENLSSLPQNEILTPDLPNFQKIYLVDKQDLLEIANIIREKKSMSGTNYLKFLEDFVNNITNVDNSKIIGELIVNTVTPMDSYIEISFDSSNIQQIGQRWATLWGPSRPITLNFGGAFSIDLTTVYMNNRVFFYQPSSTSNTSISLNLNNNSISSVRLYLDDNEAPSVEIYRLWDKQTITIMQKRL